MIVDLVAVLTTQVKCTNCHKIFVNIVLAVLGSESDLYEL